MMNTDMKNVFKIPLCFIFLIFLILSAGCGSSGNVKVMQAMQKKPEIKAKEYKVIAAESRNVDTFLSFDALISYECSEDLSFKIDYCNLKAIYVEKDDTVEEGQLLAEVDDSDLEYQLAGRQIDLQRLQLRYNKLLNEPVTENPGRNTELESLKLDMESITLDINHITELIGETRIIAPFSGVITDLVKFQPGEVVQANKKIMTIVKPGKFRLTSAVLDKPGVLPYKDISGIVTGMKISLIYGAGDNKTEIPATVTRIINTDPGVFPDANRILSAPPPLRLDIKPDGEYADKLFADRTVSFRISTGKLENVVVLPKSAIREVGQDKMIKVLKGDKVINRKVTTGFEDNAENIVVVTSGLRAGESVILN